MAQGLVVIVAVLGKCTRVLTSKMPMTPETLAGFAEIVRRKSSDRRYYVVRCEDLGHNPEDLKGRASILKWKAAVGRHCDGKWVAQ